MNQAQAFHGLAGDYQRYRPDYPSIILDALRERFLDEAKWLRSTTIVDIGAGTGISTRLLRQTFGSTYKIVGVEPGIEMVQQARENTATELQIDYIESNAEMIPFPDQAVAMIMAAQAVQWFDRPRFYAEALRVLESHGMLSIMQNNRWWQNSPFLTAYEDFLEENNPGYSRSYRDFDVQAELRALPDFAPTEPVADSWTRLITMEDFIGMSFSSTRTKPIVNRLGHERTASLLRDLVERYFSRNKSVEILYRTELYCAYRR